MPWGFIIGAGLVYGFTSGLFARALGWLGWATLIFIPLCIFSAIISFVGDAMFGPGGGDILGKFVVWTIALLGFIALVISVFGGWEAIGKWYRKGKPPEENRAAEFRAVPRPETLGWNLSWGFDSTDERRDRR